MQYDPVKNIFATIIRKNTFLRKVFYKILGALFLREWYVKRQLYQLLRDRAEPLKLYDAGCGFGQYSYYVAKKFRNVSIVAVDVKEEQIHDCKKFFSEQNITQCSFAVEDLTMIHHENEFDLILSVDVMEHISDDEAVFRNFSRALKKGGLLVINTQSTEGGSDTHSADEKSFIEEHARNGYSVDEITTKLQTAGFSILSIRYTYGKWGMAAWRIGIKIPLLLLNVSKMFFILLPFYYCFAFPFMLLGMIVDYTSSNTTGAGLLVVGKKV